MGLNEGSFTHAHHLTLKFNLAASIMWKFDYCKHVKHWFPACIRASGNLILPDGPQTWPHWNINCAGDTFPDRTQTFNMTKHVTDETIIMPKALMKSRTEKGILKKILAQKIKKLGWLYKILYTHPTGGLIPEFHVFLSYYV